MTEQPVPGELVGDTGPEVIDTNPDTADLPDEVYDGEIADIDEGDAQ